MKSKLQLSKSELLWLFLPVILALSSLIKIWPVLPAVMQDEYIYSTQSRFVAFAEQIYPNYLFSWIYSSTNVCGVGFYDCAKTLNAAFFVGTIAIVWLLARRLFGSQIAILASSVAAISPVSIYVSYFMPESMYYFFMSLTIWLAVRASQNSNWSSWLLVASSIGLASLVKPHAIFVLPALIIFGLITAARAIEGTWLKATIFQATSIAVFLAFKFGAGFAFAGTAGLTIFGGSYQSTIDDFISNVSQPLAAGSEILLDQSGDSSSGYLGIFWAIASSQLLAQLSLYLLLAGTPMLLSIRNSAQLLKSKGSFDSKASLALLITVITISLVVVVAIFEGVVSALGDNHANRMLLRYSEFLLPFFVLLGFAVMQSHSEKFGARLVNFVPIAAAIIYAAIWIPSNTELHFSDSNTLAGFLSQPWLFWFIAGLALIGAGSWLLNQEKSIKLIVWAVIPSLIVISGFAGQAELLNRVGTEKAYFDIAGQKAREILDAIQPSEILVAGTERQQVFTTKFWIDKPNLRDMIIQEGEILDSTTLGDVQYLVLVGNAELTGGVNILDQGDGYAIVELVK